MDRFIIELVYCGISDRGFIKQKFLELEEETEKPERKVLSIQHWAQ